MPKDVTVYLITKDGSSYTDEGMILLRDAVLKEVDGDGIITHTGPDLLDPAALREYIVKNPEAVIAVSAPDGIITVPRGEDNENMQIVINNLYIAEKKGNDSWTALMRMSGEKI